MASYAERMRAIEIADLIRRQDRDVAELRALGVVIDTDYAHSRNITGEPSEKNRTYRASDDCWKRGLRSRTVGTATDDGNQTVRVIHPDGTDEIRPASSFRKENVHKKQRTHAHNVATSDIADRNAAARERLQATLNAHAIGNVE